MRARGHALMLLLITLTALSAGFLVAVTRVNEAVSSRRPAGVRLQALWLARSALAAGTKGPQHVQTPHGAADVEVGKSKDGSPFARVRLAGAVAEVSKSPSGAWLERYQP